MSRIHSTLVTTVLFLAGPTVSLAQSIEDVRLHPTTERLDVSFRLEGGFSTEVTQRVQSGLPTAFVFEIELLRDRKHWWDAHVQSATIEVVAMYNAVSHEYLLNYKKDGKLVESRLARSLPELERAMTHFETWTVFRLDGIAPRTRLLIRMRAVLGAKTYLELVPANVTTDWVTSHKVRVPGPEGP
jgi:hypothetical protein